MPVVHKNFKKFVFTFTITIASTNLGSDAIAADEPGRWSQPNNTVERRWSPDRGAGIGPDRQDAYGAEPANWKVVAACADPGATTATSAVARAMASGRGRRAPVQRRRRSRLALATKSMLLLCLVVTIVGVNVHKIE